MNMKLLKTYIMALAALTLAACSEDAIVANRPTSGKAISFSASQPQTRTEYGDVTDSYVINWLTGDKVSVFAPVSEAGEVTGIYAVTPGTPANSGSLSYADEGTNIKWGDEDKEHTFFAAYGKKVSWTKNGTSAIAKCQFIKDQNVVATKQADGVTYKAPADMTCAYMMCKSVGYTPDQMETLAVELPFKPIMTTLQITVKGPATSASSVTFKTIGITIPKESDVTYAEGDNTYFDYEVNGQNDHTAKAVTNKEAQSVSVNLSQAITLKNGETLTVTAILPPVEISSTNKVKISIVSQDGNSVASFGGDVASGKKAKIVCAEFQATKYSEIDNTPSGMNEESKSEDTDDDSTPTEWNDWQTYLPDNALVCSVTLPGANFSGCYSQHGLVGNYSHHYQSLNVKYQLAQGVRVFDFNPIRSKTIAVGTNYIVEHDGVDGAAYGTNGAGKFSYRTWNSYNTSGKDDFPKVFSDFINNHPSEFCVLFMNPKSGTSDGDKETTLHAMYTLLTEPSPGWNSYPWAGKLIKFRPDLTVGECRGKIIVISRNDRLDDGSKTVKNEQGDDKTFNFALSKSIVKCKWEKESMKDVTTATEINITEAQSEGATIGKLVYQHCNANNVDNKKAAINAVANHSASNHGGAKLNIWYLNNAAGDYGERMDESIRDNCRDINPYMTQKAKDATYPLGMVLINRTNQAKYTKKGATTILGGPDLVKALIGLNFKDGVLRYKN